MPTRPRTYWNLSDSSALPLSWPTRRGASSIARERLRPSIVAYLATGRCRSTRSLPCQCHRFWQTWRTSNIVWHKLRKDGGSDGRGVGFYFRNVTELVLFGTRGKNARTLQPGRRQVNYIGTRKREHSRKPDEIYDIIEACSDGPRLELFARGTRKGWAVWGNQADDGYRPTWDTYSHNSATDPRLIASGADQSVSSPMASARASSNSRFTALVGSSKATIDLGSPISSSGHRTTQCKWQSLSPCPQQQLVLSRVLIWRPGFSSACQRNRVETSGMWGGQFLSIRRKRKAQGHNRFRSVRGDKLSEPLAN